MDGFHAGRTRWGPEQQESNITYFEFHYKPYSDHLRISLQKIMYLLPNHKRRTLANYIQTRQSNFHAAMALLQSEFSYLRSFETQARSLRIQTCFSASRIWESTAPPSSTRGVHPAPCGG